MPDAPDRVAPDPADPVALTRALIRCPSVTPADAGALDVAQRALEAIGFTVERMPFQEPGTERVDNLYARIGPAGAPNFCFAGHTDVVPPGDPAAWRHDPFSATIEDGVLYGRGSADMKSAVAAFVTAAARRVARCGPPRDRALSLLLTGDEEAIAVNGTRKVLERLAERGERLDACLVGEPSNPERLGDMMKIGRRGSATFTLTVRGIQGHSAYPHLADNPIHRLVAMLHGLTREPVDEGSEHFPATTLAVTTVDVGNPAANVIPARARAVFNVRFNDLHDSAALEAWVRQRLDAVGGSYELEVRVSGESFLTAPGPLTRLVAEAVEAVTGRAPELSTTGGTSDARFVKDYCPVVEFGAVSATIHQVDEHLELAAIEQLAQVYERVIDRFLDGGYEPS